MNGNRIVAVQPRIRTAFRSIAPKWSIFPTSSLLMTSILPNSRGWFYLKMTYGTPQVQALYVNWFYQCCFATSPLSGLPQTRGSVSTFS